MPFADPMKAAEDSRQRCKRYYGRNAAAQRARGLATYHADPGRSHEQSARWKLTHPAAAKAMKRKAWLKSAYGLTPEGFDTLLEAQNMACAGCLEPFNTTPLVDHCHVTGKVRGLLCKSCNTTLGMSHDNPQTLRRLAAYLERT